MERNFVIFDFKIQIMNKGGISAKRLFLVSLCIAAMISCSPADIEDYQDVMNHIQGTWTGHEYNKGIHRHIKLIISDNTFNGWIQVSDDGDEPEWTAIPGEEGTFSLSSILDDPDSKVKFRKMNFYMRGRCCGDNSLTARMLSNLVAYYEGNGLSVTGRQPMARK